MPDWLIAALIQLLGLAAVGGALYWRVGRLERDVDSRATVERVSGLEKRLDSIEGGIEKKLDKLEAMLEQLRSDVLYRRRGADDTDPGRAR